MLATVLESCVILAAVRCFILSDTIAVIQLDFPVRYHKRILVLPIEAKARVFSVSVSILGRELIFRTKIGFPIGVVVG